MNNKPEITLIHEFVEFIPASIQEKKLYISIAYATATHKCCCGCGKEVVTPLSPTDWKLIFDGQSVSLDPSIGNWSFDCRSHYWIKRNKVIWAGAWSQERIDNGRSYDRKNKELQYNKSQNHPAPQSIQQQETHHSKKRDFWAKISYFWRF